jgi:alkylhydroperoxidase/carboxymuconolactone decarboxylase family protein YurZ
MTLKQTDAKKLQRSRELLESLKKRRGGTLHAMHKRIANDPRLLQAFIEQLDLCNRDSEALSPKHRELVTMAICCAQNAVGSARTHARQALENGSSLEEICEVLRIVFFTCGALCLNPASEILEEIDA